MSVPVQFFGKNVAPELFTHSCSNCSPGTSGVGDSSETTSSSSWDGGLGLRCSRPSDSDEDSSTSGSTSESSDELELEFEDVLGLELRVVTSLSGERGIDPCGW